MNSTITDQSLYQALDRAKPEIRLIKLHQGSRDQGLRCTLETVSLDDQPAFHALSYAWGSDTEKCRIDINGHEVPVSSTLATVLQNLRSHHHDSFELHSLPLWVDAICINQADPAERAQQVRLMGRIYRQASRVLPWIGEGDKYSDYALDRMNDATFRALCSELETSSRTPNLDEVRVKIIMDRNIEKRRYWKRVWTVQEVVLATEDPIIVCGSRRLPLSWYTECQMVLPANQSSYPSLALGWAAIQKEVPWHHDYTIFGCSISHDLMRLLYQNSGAILLGEALAVTADLDATDPRDRIYGIMGLIPQREMLMVDIDYSMTPERLSRDTMTVVWTSGMKSLIGFVIPELLSVRCTDDIAEVPSWAPNVLKKGRRLASEQSACLREYREWRPETQAEIHVEGSILRIKAIPFESISDTLQLQFNYGCDETSHSGRASGEVDVGPLQNIEAMAQRGLNIPMSASSRLAPFSMLRGKLPIWSALSFWGDGTDKWLAGVERDKHKLWEILLGRQEIPEHWKTACPPELRSNLPALEAAILSPLLHAISRRVHDSKVFISRSGFLGVATEMVEPGDIITLIVGMTAMYVLRPFRDGYRIVGFASVSGLMNWDDLDEAMKAGSLREQEMKIY